MLELQIYDISVGDMPAIQSLLDHMQPLAVTLRDAADTPLLEPSPGESPLWPNIHVQVIFQTDDALALCDHVLKKLYPTLRTEKRALHQKVWEDEWKIHTKPLCFGDRLWICPSHCPPPHPEAVNVILDPGLGFGTGTHPTTARCLTFLDKTPLEGKTVLDFGCGSGILMIAALKLGAKYAYGIDIDPQALEASHQNAIQNHLTSRDYRLGNTDVLPSIGKVDIIIANILFNPLINLKSTFLTHLNPDATLVVSGILNEQVPSLIKAYAPQLKHQQTQHQDEWGMVIFHP